MNKRLQRQLTPSSETTSIQRQTLDDETSLLLFFSMGAKTRRRVLVALVSRLLNCNQIASELKLDWWTVAKHLGRLEQAKLIKCVNIGRIRFYKATSKGESACNS